MILRVRLPPTPLMIRKSRRKDYPSLKQIAEMKFGQDFSEEEEFFEDTDISLVVEVDGEIAAFGTAGMITEEDHPELSEHMGQKTGMLFRVAVSPKFERQGIASQLAKERIEFLEQMGCDVILATAWATNGVAHVGKILERNGFEKVGEIPNYWEEFGCVRCGEKCSCTAVIFKLNMAT